MRTMPFVVAALMASASAVEHPGLGASITSEGISNIKNIAAPFIFKFLQDIKIPKLEIQGGEFDNIEVKLPQPALSNIVTSLDGKNNGIELAVDNATGTINADFTFTYLFTVKGKAAINIKKIGIDFDIGAATQAGQFNELAPKINLVKSNIKIDPSDIDVKLTGGAVARIASVLIPLIKNSVIPGVISGIQDGLKKAVDNTVNPDLAKYGNSVTIPYLAGVTFDYSMQEGGFITDGSVGQVHANGTFWDINAPEHYSEVAAVYPSHNPKGKSFQVYLTQYVANTMFQAGFDTGNTLDITALLEKYLKVDVTTDYLAILLPEFVNVYGSGKKVAISASFVKAPGAVSVTPAGAEVKLNLHGTFKVEGSDALSGQLENIDFAAFLQAIDGTLTGKIGEYSIGQVSDFQTSLGITADQFTQTVQDNVNKYIGIANTDLAAGIYIKKFFGIDAHDVEINNYNGYIEAGLNATPATFEGIQDLWVAYKAEFDRIEAGEYKTVKYEKEDVEQFLF